jgi:hypothetical protein
MAGLVSAVFKRAREQTKRFFRFRVDVAEHASGRVETLKRKEMEVERLDRLRNPGDYRGR